MRLGSKARTAGGRARLGKLYGMAMAFLLAPAFLWGQSGLLAMDLALIASDGFEGNSFSSGTGWLAPWDISGAADVVPSEEPYSGASHLRLRGGAVASRSLDLSGWVDVELGFWARADSLEFGDSVRLEVSSDGNAWMVLETWQDGDDHNEYHLYEFALADMTMSSAFSLRFVSQMNEPSDYFFVDEVMLWGEPLLTGAPTPEPAPVAVPPSSPVSTEDLVIDGAFSDWEGYPHLPDPSGDANKARGDLAAFYWANNGDSETNYWMIERHPLDDEGDEENERRPKDDKDRHDNAHSKKVKYTIHIDTDNNGSFTEKEDRRVLVDYRPRANDSEVRVRVKRGRGGMTISSARGDWGESESEGGKRVEFEVNWNDLSLASGDVIRMYVESDREDDRLPDSGDNQWTPASVLGYVVLGAALLGSALTFWRIRRKRERICPSGER